MVRDVRPQCGDLPGADEGQGAAVATRGLYPTLLGTSWFDLAESVRRAHADGRPLYAHGSLHVEHGDRLLARFLARLLRLPGPAPAAESRLVVTPGDAGEQWQRTIGRQLFTSRQYDAGGGELAERFSLFEFRFRLQPAAGGLTFDQVGTFVRCGFAAVPLPRIWWPRVEAHEAPAGARCTHISVRVAAPFVGLIIAYQGTMETEDRRP